MATIRINTLNPKFIKAEGLEKQEIIMIRVIISIDTDQIVKDRRMSFGGRPQ